MPSHIKTNYGNVYWNATLCSFAPAGGLKSPFLFAPIMVQVSINIKQLAMWLILQPIILTVISVLFVLYWVRKYYVNLVRKPKVYSEISERNNILFNTLVTVFSIVLGRRTTDLVPFNIARLKQHPNYHYNDERVCSRLCAVITLILCVCDQCRYTLCKCGCVVQYKLSTHPGKMGICSATCSTKIYLPKL